MKEFSKALSKAMSKTNKTPTDMANLLDVSDLYFSNIKDGRFMPSCKFVEKCEKLFLDAGLKVDLMTPAKKSVVKRWEIQS